MTSGKDGGLVEVRSDLGPGTAAGQDQGALGPGVLDVGADPLELGGRGERAHVGVEGQVRRQPHRARRDDERLQELVGDALVQVQPLDRDAELAGR